MAILQLTYGIFHMKWNFISLEVRGCKIPFLYLVMAWIWVLKGLSHTITHMLMPYSPFHFLLHGKSYNDTLYLHKTLGFLASVFTNIHIILSQHTSEAGRTDVINPSWCKKEVSPRPNKSFWTRTGTARSGDRQASGGPTSLYSRICLPPKQGA